jgi:cephalosporin hydroxylase
MPNSAEQPGVPGLFENSLRVLRDKPSRRPAEETWLADLTRIQSRCQANQPTQGYADRLAQTGRHTDIPFVTLACSQGVDQPFEWRKLAVYKTVWDLAIYQMLMSALQPRTVIELGSGSGGSAVWLADMGVAAGADCQVHTFDITPPNVEHERVSVHQADFRSAGIDLLSKELPELIHPILVIEDAHVAVDRMLRMTEPILEAGDYLVVEDSYRKQPDLKKFAESTELSFEVATWLTDFYGINATCACNSIWVCTGSR